MAINNGARALLSIMLMAGISACSHKEPAPDPATQTPAAEPAADTPRTEPKAPDAWTLSETGIGPYRVGMTLAEARAAGDLLPITDTTSSCYYFRPKSGPAGITMMMVDGHIARVNADSAVVATVAGAKVGDTEKRITELYAGKVDVTPHKYVQGGHYLTVMPGPGDNRIVFETDGKVVTRFRGGRLPEVGWVEGCS